MTSMPSAEALQRLVDESAIRDLAARFSDAVDRADRDAFRALWTPDGVWEIGEPHAARASGNDAIMAMLDRLMAGWAFFVQLTHSGVIDFRVPDRASARWIIREFARSTNHQRSYDNFAIYEDEMVRRDGVWRFARRAYHYVWLDDKPISGRSFRLPPDLGHVPRPEGAA